MPDVHKASVCVAGVQTTDGSMVDKVGHNDDSTAAPAVNNNTKDMMQQSVSPPPSTSPRRRSHNASRTDRRQPSLARPAAVHLPYPGRTAWPGGAKLPQLAFRARLIRPRKVYVGYSWLV